MSLFSHKTTVRGFKVEIEAEVVGRGRNTSVYDMVAYKPDGTRCDWIFAKCSGTEMTALENELIEMHQELVYG
jgi:hypothetical protein